MSDTTKTETVYTEYDTIVVGHGVSGLSTGIAAHEAGTRPVILEKSSQEERGGHTQFAGGLFRFPMEDPETVASDLNLDESVERYSKRDFMEDLQGVSGGRANDELCDVFVQNAYDTIRWLTDHGVDWQVVDHSEEPGFGTTVGTVQAVGEGQGVVDALAARAEELGITIHYDTEFRSIETDSKDRVEAAQAAHPDGKVRYEAPSVVIAAGSYVANAEKRTRYFGRDGDAYTVRGSRYNTGEALDAALEAGAKPEGQWGGAHQVLNDANAPDVEGGRARINGYQYGVVLNVEGERFIDEGEDFLLKTYAKFGQRVYDQPKQKAFVVFDSSVDDLVVSQMGSEPIEAETLEELVKEVGIEEPSTALETIQEFNEATDVDSFDPNSLDRNSTDGLDIKKSNWAKPIAESPFKCFPVDAAITFAFGGLKINSESQVLDRQENLINGLWAVGNSTAEFFYGNYPGGSALSRGATFGRIAGTNATEHAQSDEGGR